MFNKSKILVLFISIIFIFSFFSCTGQEVLEPVSFTLTVLHTNDTHGHPVAFDDYPMSGVGGQPARMTLIEQVRSENENVLLLDAGDVLTGRPESNFFNAEPDFLGMNYMGYDAMTIGNHEFDKSLDKLFELQELAQFPFINANIYKDGEPLFQEYVIFEFNGAKVAVFGLITAETPTVTMPEYVKDLEFKDPVEVAKELVPELEKKAHIVIALTHLGYYEGNTEGRTFLGDETLAREVSGIDLIIGGHSHTYFEEPVKINDTYVTSARHWGMYLGMVNIVVEDGLLVSLTGMNRPINLTTRFKPADGIPDPEHPEWVIGNPEDNYNYQYLMEPLEKDAGLLELLTPYVEKVDEELSVVIGTAVGAFTDEKNRTDDNPLCNMVCDAMRIESGADVFLQNGGGVRAGIGEGEISKADIYQTMPFDNSVQLFDITGEQLMEVFNFAATVPNGKGAFLQVSGVTFTLNYKTQQAEDVMINGEPIDLTKTYRAGTNSFVKTGGDGYTMLVDKNENFYETSLFQRDMIISYIENVGEVKVEDYDDNRINIVQ